MPGIVVAGILGEPVDAGQVPSDGHSACAWHLRHVPSAPQIGADAGQSSVCVAVVHCTHCPALGPLVAQ
jgi:hypothetical protein